MELRHAKLYRSAEDTLGFAALTPTYGGYGACPSRHKTAHIFIGRCAQQASLLPIVTVRTRSSRNSSRKNIPKSDTFVFEPIPWSGRCDKAMGKASGTERRALMDMRRAGAFWFAARQVVGNIELVEEARATT